MGSNLVIRQLEDEQKGLLIPKSTFQEAKAIGEVVALPENISETIKIGDKVIYDEFSGSYIPGEDNLLIIDIENVLAKIYVQ